MFLLYAIVLNTIVYNGTLSNKVYKFFNNFLLKFICYYVLLCRKCNSM